MGKSSGGSTTTTTTAGKGKGKGKGGNGKRKTSVKDKVQGLLEKAVGEVEGRPGKKVCLFVFCFIFGWGKGICFHTFGKKTH